MSQKQNKMLEVPLNSIHFQKNEIGYFTIK